MIKLVDDECYSFKDGEDLLGYLVSVALDATTCVERYGMTVNFLKDFYYKITRILALSDFEPVLSPGTRVDVTKDPLTGAYCYYVQKFDPVNRRYFLTYKSRSCGGIFGFWISSLFVKKHKKGKKS